MKKCFLIMIYLLLVNSLVGQEDSGKVVQIDNPNYDHQLADSLESVEKIRILVGLNVDQKTFELIDTVRTQTNIDFNSHKNTRTAAMEAAVTEIDASGDDYLTEYGIKKFIKCFLNIISN